MHTRLLTVEEDIKIVSDLTQLNRSRTLVIAISLIQIPKLFNFLFGDANFSQGDR
jgi:hypothetical protein